MIRMMKSLSCILLFSALFCVEASAQTTIKAASCSESDVQSAIGKATTDSNIVQIPAGTCSWSSQMKISVSNSVTIQGAGAEYATSGGASTSGTDQTIIEDDVPTNGMMIITVPSGKSFRLTGIDFTWDSNNSGGTVYNGIVQVGGTSHSVQIDHCHFNNLNGLAVRITGSITGVADYNVFDNVHGAFSTNNGYSWAGGSEGGPGDQSWADGDHWGTSQFMFYEDNQLNGGGLDCWNGGRYVFRYNTFTSINDSVFEHGTDGAGRNRSCRAAEVYGNNFQSPTGTSPSGQATTFINGGAMLYWGNTDVGWRQMIVMEDSRDNYSSYTEYQPPQGWGYCGTSINGLSSAWDQNTDSSGYACIDQPGRGAGDLLTGDFPNALNSATGTISWPNQALDPVYVWDNNYTPIPNESLDAIAVGALGPVLQNRDFYVQFGAYGETGTFNGTKGIGQGSTVPTMSCTQNVGYWDTTNQTLYRCNSSGKWAAYYTPYTYPYPTDNSSASRPSPPSSLSATAQ